MTDLRTEKNLNKSNLSMYCGSGLLATGAVTGGTYLK